MIGELRVVLDIKYELHEVPIKEMRKKLSEMLSELSSTGALSCDTQAEMSECHCRIDIVANYAGTPVVDQQGLAANVFRITWPSGIVHTVIAKQNVQPFIEARKKLGAPKTVDEVFAEVERQVKAKRAGAKRPRVICVVESGVVQGARASEDINFDVLDFDCKRMVDAIVEDGEPTQADIDEHDRFNSLNDESDDLPEDVY